MGLRQEESNTPGTALHMSERVSNNSTEPLAGHEEFQTYQVGSQNHQEEFQKSLEEFKTCQEKSQSGRVSNTRKSLKHDRKCCKERGSI